MDLEAAFYTFVSDLLKGNEPNVAYLAPFFTSAKALGMISAGIERAVNEHLYSGLDEYTGNEDSDFESYSGLQ